MSGGAATTARPAATTARPAGSLGELLASNAPVLIFEVDAAGIAEEAAPARHCDVRLIGSVRAPLGPRPPVGGPAEELSAVLVLRALTPSRLMSCVRAVTRGGRPMAPERLCQMLPASHDGAELERQLSQREFDVLQMLADGDSTREIAERLSYSERTVKNIVRAILDKLNCRTRAQAAALAARQGVI